MWGPGQEVICRWGLVKRTVMVVNVVIGIIGTVAAVASAIAALGSRKAARAANLIAEGLAALERDRRHDDLAPQFEIMCWVVQESVETAHLLVRLEAGRLDGWTVTVTILDMGPFVIGNDEMGYHGLTREVAEAFPGEEVERFVWGPWEFSMSADTQVKNNRQSRPRLYSRVSGENSEVFVLSRTQRPPYARAFITEDLWRQSFTDQPVRLLLTCQHDGYEPWFIRRDVKVHRDLPQEMVIDFPVPGLHRSSSEVPDSRE